MNQQQQAIKDLMDAHTKSIQRVTTETSYRHLQKGVLSETRIILTAYASVTAVAKSMRDTLLKMGVNEQLVREIDQK